MNIKMQNPTDMICAPATSTGSGAVSMIRVSGQGCLAAVDHIVRFVSGSATESKGYVLKRGDIPGVDEVVVGIYRAPHSYTGEDSAELCCHASPFIVSRILELLCASGCRLAEAGEFTRRAFTNGKMDLAQAEAVADLIAAGSEAQHRVALTQLRGGYSEELSRIRASLLELTSLLELELDFSEEELEFADRDRLASIVDAAILRCDSLADSFRTGNAIRNGVPVAIVGAPNSGKSTLLNALLKDERALVSDIPGTTRDTVEETCVMGGLSFRFIDTAGIRETDDQVERMGIERALDKAAKADIVLGLVDAGETGLGVLLEQAEKIASMLDLSRQKLVLLLNKADRPGRVDAGLFSEKFHAILGEKSGFSAHNKNVIGCNNNVLSFEKQIFSPAVLEISAKFGTGLEKLRETLVSLVGKLPEDAVLVTNARHVEALRQTSEALRVVREGLSTLPGDLLAEDLRAALASLGTITGEITTDEVLGEIFGKFCIGK